VKLPRLVVACAAAAACFGACATAPSKPDEPGAAAAAARRPDERALARTTRVEARRVRLLVSDRWRKDGRLEGIVVERPDPQRDDAKGGARFRLKGLDVAAEELEVRWLPDYEDLFLYASRVALFHQERDQRPYHSTNLSAVSMAIDEVSFFQQEP
jgi:hypothetical protein